MVDVMKQAVARVSKVFLDGVAETLGHEFSAEERVQLCGELEAFMAVTIMLVKEIPAGGREGHEVIDEALELTSPVLVSTILEKTGESGEKVGVSGDKLSERLMTHVRAFFTLTSMSMLVLGRQNQKKEEE